MIDHPARIRALELAKQLSSGTLSVAEFEDQWPKRSMDLGVRSIGFWIWTLFSDDDDGLIDATSDGAVSKTLGHAIAFLSSDSTFEPRERSRLQKFRDRLVHGVEWKDCELPWHDVWPNTMTRPIDPRSREPLLADKFYEQFYLSSGLDRALVIELLEHVAQEVRIPAELIRPDDRFAVELAPGRGNEWDSGYAILLHELASLARKRKRPITKPIATVDDYLRVMAEVY
jgi:hypothetical protein